MKNIIKFDKELDDYGNVCTDSSLELLSRQIAANTNKIFIKKSHFRFYNSYIIVEYTKKEDFENFYLVWLKTFNGYIRNIKVRKKIF